MRILNVEPERYGTDARAALHAAGDVDYVACGSQDDLMIALTAHPYDALVTRLGLTVDASVFDAAPLRWVVTATTGLDHIDLAAAGARGVEVVSLKGEVEFLESVKTTAEHTWALLLALRRRLLGAHADVVAGRWRRQPFLADELDGATLGVVGCGRLGRMVAGYGLAFGMDVLAHDTDPSHVAAAPPGTTAASLETLLATADVVSLHLPLEPHTLGFLSADRFGVMKPGAVLVNTARGELIDEEALLHCLVDGRLAGAALDVLAGDSRWSGDVPAGHPLVRYAGDHDNLVLSPHMGGYGRRGLERTRTFVSRKFAAIAAGRGAGTAQRSMT